MIQWELPFDYCLLLLENKDLAEAFLLVQVQMLHEDL